MMQGWEAWPRWIMLTDKGQACTQTAEAAITDTLRRCETALGRNVCSPSGTTCSEVAPGGRLDRMKLAGLDMAGSGYTVSVIDTVTHTVTGTIPTDAVTATIAVGDHPNGIAFTPDGTATYVTNDGGNTVSVINTTTSTVTGLATGFAAPRGIAVART